MKKLAADGVRPRDAAGQLRMHPYYAEKLFAQAEAFSPEELRAGVVRLAELDGALKGQSKLAPDLEVQRALVDLTSQGAPSGQRRDDGPGPRGFGIPGSIAGRLAAGSSWRWIRRLTYPAAPAAIFAACDFFRAAVLACSAPRLVARSIVRTSSRCSEVTRSASPSAAALSSRFVSVLIVER